GVVVRGLHGARHRGRGAAEGGGGDRRGGRRSRGRGGPLARGGHPSARWPGPRRRGRRWSGNAAGAGPTAGGSGAGQGLLPLVVLLTPASRAGWAAAEGSALTLWEAERGVFPPGLTACWS